MSAINQLQAAAIETLKRRIPVTPVRLKHPFPVRPSRMLGLVRFDGEVFSSDILNRAVFMQIRLPAFMKVYSTFISPKIDYDLPVFICEAVQIGSKRVFIVDAHKSGPGGPNQYEDFFDRLLTIRARYPELMKHQKVAAKGIAMVNSRAACQVRIPAELDGQAADLFAEYFTAYLDLVQAARPLTGPALDAVRVSFSEYLKTVVDHDPGVKGNIIFFGRKQGIERALDIFYGL